jgi:ABC-type multidrug transport system fused ATPase/permease subunit
VQQNPWIQNKTIKENILFGLPFDEAKYEETIDIC